MGKGHRGLTCHFLPSIFIGFIDDLFQRGNLLFSMNISTGQCTKLLDAKLRFVRGHQNNFFDIGDNSKFCHQHHDATNT